jgi:hypothetical protein
LFDGLGAVRLGRRDQADGDAFLTGTPGTADAVNVDFGIARQFDVDDHVQGSQCPGHGQPRPWPPAPTYERLANMAST